MSDTDRDEEDPTAVHFVDGTSEAYSVVVRRYDSNWLYALRPGTPANHCVLNAENVTRIEAQTVTRVDGGVGYCDFDWRDEIGSVVQQDSWIASDDGDHRSPDDERARGGSLGDLDEALERHDYPTTTDELVEAYGDREVESKGGWTSVEEVLAPVGDETYSSAEEARDRILNRLHRE